MKGAVRWAGYAAGVLATATTSVRDTSDLADLSIRELEDELGLYAAHLSPGVCRGPGARAARLPNGVALVLRVDRLPVRAHAARCARARPGRAGIGGAAH